MNSILKVGSWDNPSNSYKIDLEHQTFCSEPWVGEEWKASAGTVKFYLGKPVFLFQADKVWNVWIPGFCPPTPLNSVKVKVTTKFRIIRSMELYYEGARRKYFQLNVSGLLEKVDPTFDEFDKDSEDFFYRLESLRRKSIGKKDDF